MYKKYLEAATVLLAGLLDGIAWSIPLLIPTMMPFMGIWSCNELFILDIPYDWRSILAASWLSLVFGGFLPYLRKEMTKPPSPMDEDPPPPCGAD
jgi:hypothetical protein